MRGASFRLSLFSAGLFAIACGARTGDDELFGYDDGVGIGIGGSETGGVAATGGRPFVGGGTSTGGTGTGGTNSTGGSFGSCCSEHLELGCNDPLVADCVCNSGPNPDPFCCANSWDVNCVVGASACGACGSTGGTTSTGGSVGTGGTSTGGSVGGTTSTGGSVSTGAASSTGGSSNSGGFGGIIGIGGSSNSGGAGGTGGTGTGGAGGATNSCCVANDEPRCDDPDVEQCVCSFDSYCCTNAWDAQCAREATSCGASCPISGPNQCDAPTNLCSQCLCESCLGPFTSCSVGQNCAGLVLCSFLAGCACF